MNELQLIIVEGKKSEDFGQHHVELGIPIRDPVEREGEQFIVMSAKCTTLAAVQQEIKNYKAILDELGTVAKVNFRRWEREARVIKAEVQ